ncbi:MAG: HEPN domain-containing protein [Clostridiales bacterium]|jgi:HEPN domain-containing protein|nr:HEPN domain-containing protein [Clostridiales bacterium]
MTQLANDWLSLAAADMKGAGFYLGEPDEIAVNYAAYHCQQAAEKLVKAVYIEKKIEFQRVHELRPLLTKLVDSGVNIDVFKTLFDWAEEISQWAEKTRYAVAYLAARERVREVFEELKRVQQSLNVAPVKEECQQDVVKRLKRFE